MANPKSTVLVKKDEWQMFLQTVAKLVKVHTRLLKHSKKSRERGSRVTQKKMRRSSMQRVCINCSRKVAENAKYCDICGIEVPDETTIP